MLNKEFKDFYDNICTLRFLNSTNLLRRIFPTTCSRFANSTTRQQVVRQILVTNNYNTLFNTFFSQA